MERSSQQLQRYSRSPLNLPVVEIDSGGDIYFFMLWNGPVSYSPRRQPTVSTSTAEAEYIGECNASKEAYFLSQALTELGYPMDGPVDLRADNQAFIKMADNPVKHSRTKHIDIKYHYVRELIENEHITLTYVSTKEMIADGLTKPLRPDLFRGFVEMLGLTSSPSEDI